MFSSNTSQVSNAATYIEDVFSTYLYTGNSSSQTITNGIDLSTYGGMVWIKDRTSAYPGSVFDTVRNNGYLNTPFTSAVNAAGGGVPPSSGIYPFNTNGFRFADGLAYWNMSGDSYVSWTFRKQPKFFDVVTFTTPASGGLTVNHSLGSVPGCIIYKKVNGTSDWRVWHRSLTSDSYYMYLNATIAQNDGVLGINPTATSFSVNTSWNVDPSSTYVAYLFAHNAGGFGLTGTDNVISCGSFTTDGSGNASVNLGYEPQWVMMKRSDGAGSWMMFDNMRGMTVNTTNGDKILFANLSDAESSVDWIQPTATGFNPYNIAWNATYVYIAIRRGPMKTPTSGTSVLSSNTSSGGAGTVITTGFPVDMQIARTRDSASQYGVVDRLRGTTSTTSGSSLVLNTAATDAEFSSTSNARAWDNTGFQMPSNWSGTNTIFWNFRRAPSFFDEVCYTGNGTTGSARNHNLGVVPELTIIKPRSAAGGDWMVMYNTTATTYSRMLLDTTDAAINGMTYSAGYDFSAQPTATTFTPGGNYLNTNQSGTTYVAYLFASCPGVSKFGTYTGTGATQTINCGFAGGARFVMIKRTDDISSWIVWDTTRGMVAGNDPRLGLNSVGSETNADWVFTVAGGFQIVTTSTFINASGGSYIYLAIA